MSFPTSVNISTLDLRTLTYLAPADENLSCPICHSPLIEPVTTRCRHTFCAACIASSLECAPSCPVDRKPLKPDGVAPAPIMVASMVNDLVVLCPNAELGCPTTCARYLLGGHLREDCAFVAVECEGCEDVVLRKDAGGECLHQVVECVYCGDGFRKLDMEAHENQCPQIIAQCPHCTEEFTRSTIISHSFSCPAAIIPCTASDVGCPYSGPRVEAPEHYSVCAFTLLRPILQAHAERLSTLELENRALRKKIDILLPPRNSPLSDMPVITVFDDQTIQLLTEQEHLRSDIERLSANLGEMEIKQSMLLMNETLRTKEEMAGIRAAINGIRMQIHWLLTVRMHNTVAGSGGGATGQAAGGGGGGGGSGGGPVVVPVRRVTDSPGDRVKL